MESINGLGDKSSHSVKAAPVLEDCCAHAAHCRLHQLHRGQVVDATFHSFSADRIVLHVGPGSNSAMQPECLCCVAFPHQQSLYAFLGCVHKVRDVNGIMEVHFDLPTTLIATNLRRYYRVPVAPVIPRSTLELSLQMPDATMLSVEVLNLSESGAEVNLRSVDDSLPVGTEIQLELQFRDDRIELPAVVRRQHLSRRGLEFALQPCLEARPRLATLQRIVRSVEQVWLKSRKE